MSAAAVVDALNRATCVGGTAIAHDARGNLTGYGASQTWGYDADNRLVSGAGGLAFSYDALGRLFETAKTGSATTYLLYDGADLIAEYEPSSSSPVVQRRYVHGPGADEPLVWYGGSGTSDRRFLVADERGSVVAVTNSSGAAIQINSYDPYGKPGGNNLGVRRAIGAPTPIAEPPHSSTPASNGSLVDWGWRPFRRRTRPRLAMKFVTSRFEAAA